MDADELIAEVCQAWRPPPRLTLSEWADRHAVLSAESSAEVGRWRTIPYQKGIMDAITDRNIESVTVMKSARVGWTIELTFKRGTLGRADDAPYRTLTYKTYGNWVVRRVSSAPGTPRRHR